MSTDADAARVRAARPSMDTMDIDMDWSDPRYPAEDGWSTLPAPAKLNLFLRITGRRADGYHQLQTVFRILDWGDSIHLRLRDDGRIKRHGESLPGLAPDDDLLVRAASALHAVSGGAAGQGVDVAVTKRIPAGGGLGGGSSDAASVLLGLDRLWGLDWGVSRLAGIGLGLGADVPVFVHGENAWAEGVGEVLTPIALPTVAYLLLAPVAHSATAALFQTPDLTRDSPPATMSDFVSGKDLGNAFEPVLRRREPAVEAAFRCLAPFGRVRLTGSGSVCFVECASRDAAHDAHAALLAREPAMAGRVWVAEGAPRSALHVALARHERGP